MCRSICSAPCHECSIQSDCNGCMQTGGQPFDKPCFIARYIQLGGMEAMEAFKQQLIEELNGLQIPGMPTVTDLIALSGRFVNLPYPLPSGQSAAFLAEDEVYLGTQLPCEYDDSRCFGVIVGMGFLLVSSYDALGTNPELILYKKR